MMCVCECECVCVCVWEWERESPISPAELCEILSVFWFNSPGEFGGRVCGCFGCLCNREHLFDSHTVCVNVFVSLYVRWRECEGERVWVWMCVCVFSRQRRASLFKLWNIMHDRITVTGLESWPTAAQGVQLSLSLWKKESCRCFASIIWGN